MPESTIKTQSWFAGLMEGVRKLEESQDFVEPRGAIEEQSADGNPKVLGEMTPTMRALYTLWQQEEERVERLLLDLKYSRNGVDGKALTACIAGKSQVEGFRYLFWAEVENQFSTSSEGESLGVRQGFKVVQLAQDPRNRLLHALLGIDG